LSAHILGHMENTNGTKTGSTLGRILVTVGLLVAAIGAVLIIASMSTGNGGTPVTWGILLLGLVIAALGFGARVLAALEKR
jgi:hypothetical protein